MKFVKIFCYEMSPVEFDEKLYAKAKNQEKNIQIKLYEEFKMGAGRKKERD